MKTSVSNDKPEIEYFAPAQAARFISISRRYLGHLTAMGVIPVHRIGKKCIRYSRKDLISAMASFRHGG